PDEVRDAKAGFDAAARKAHPTEDPYRKTQRAARTASNRPRPSDPGTTAAARFTARSEARSFDKWVAEARSQADSARDERNTARAELKLAADKYDIAKQAAARLNIDISAITGVSASDAATDNPDVFDFFGDSNFNISDFDDPALAPEV